MADQVPAQPAAPAAPVDVKSGIPPAVLADAEVDLGGMKLKASEIKKQLELAKGAQKAMQEKASLEKNYSNFFAGLKTDPAGTIRNMLQQGVLNEAEAVQLATELYRDRVYNPAKLPKEQLEAQEMSRKLKVLEAEKAERETQAAEAKKAQEVAAAKQYVASQLRAAFEKHKDIPETADVIRFAAKHKNIAQAAGQPISYEEAVVRGWSELKALVKRIAEQHNEDSVLDYTGEELAEKINKAYLKRLKAKEKAKDMPLPSDVGPSQNSSRPMSKKEQRMKHIQETVARITGQSQAR